MENKDLVYIYNIYQKRFYLKNGARMIDAQLNNKTNKICWIFSKEETKELFKEWIKLSEGRVLPLKSNVI